MKNVFVKTCLLVLLPSCFSN